MLGQQGRLEVAQLKWNMLKLSIVDTFCPAERLCVSHFVHLAAGPRLNSAMAQHDSVLFVVFKRSSVSNKVYLTNGSILSSLCRIVAQCGCPSLLRLLWMPAHLAWCPLRPDHLLLNCPDAP
eukprot:evm.model.scf_1627.2 EVM.evm.TU.scf_1627.2   scf_1627:13174-13539(-)